MMHRRQRLAVAIALGLGGFAAACTAAPEYRWMKAGVDGKTYEKDRVTCLQTVDREFNPYYDFGPPGAAPTTQALFRDREAEDMFRNCMRQRGYRLVTIDPPQQR
jgi:hypothetical protein